MNKLTQYCDLGFVDVDEINHITFNPEKNQVDFTIKGDNESIFSATGEFAVILLGAINKDLAFLWLQQLQGHNYNKVFIKASPAITNEAE